MYQIIDLNVGITIIELKNEETKVNVKKMKMKRIKNQILII